MNWPIRDNRTKDLALNNAGETTNRHICNCHNPPLIVFTLLTVAIYVFQVWFANDYSSLEDVGGNDWVCPGGWRNHLPRSLGTIAVSKNCFAFCMFSSRKLLSCLMQSICTLLSVYKVKWNLNTGYLYTTAGLEWKLRENITNQALPAR